MAKNKIIDELKKQIPDLSGFISIKKLDKTVIVSGEAITSDEAANEKLEALVSKKYPGIMFANSVEFHSGLTVVEDEDLVTTEAKGDDILDEVKIVHIGYLPVNVITQNAEFKFINNEYLTQVDDCVKVLDFISPIILDSNLKVIDGNMRLEIAKINKMKKVPVVVINDAGDKANFLRLALNRSSEFQRWVYAEIDEFVDSIPQVQPLLEPLGFFGKLLLPTSFFANTVVNYRLDEYNEQQKKYRQEMGIAAWAELMRERNEKEIEAKKPRKKEAKPKNLTSLFDLIPTEKDFMPVHDIEKDIKEHQEAMREVAQTITTNYDEIRKPELMAAGKWQGTRRTSSEKSADLRAEAEASEKETIEETPIVDETPAIDEASAKTKNTTKKASEKTSSKDDSKKSKAKKSTKKPIAEATDSETVETASSPKTNDSDVKPMAEDKLQETESTAVLEQSDKNEAASTSVKEEETQSKPAEESIDDMFDDIFGDDF